MRSIRPRRFQAGGVNPASVGLSTVPNVTIPSATGTTGGGSATNLAAAALGAPSASGTPSGAIPIGNGRWGMWDPQTEQQALAFNQAMPGLFQMRPQTQQALQALYPNIQGGKDISATGGAAAGAATTGTGSPQPSPAASSQPLTDAQISLNNANALRTAAANLTTGPTPVGAQAAQAAQSALAKPGMRRGGKVKRFQSGGANDGTETTNDGTSSRTRTSNPDATTSTRTDTPAPSSTSTPAASSGLSYADYASLTPAQQQAYSSGDPNYAQAGQAAPAAAAPAGPAYTYNPLAPPSANATPPAGFQAVPFGTGTSVTYTPAAYQAQILAEANSPMMTPAAILNQAIVANAGLPPSLQGNPNVTINGQQVPYNSLTNEQQAMLSYFGATGQNLPSNFLSTYQGPSALWNDSGQNAATIPSGSTLMNGALVNNTGGGFTFPGSFSGTQPASPTAAPTTPNTSSPGGIGTSPGTFTANATGTGVGTGSGATGTTPVAAAPAVAQSPTGSAGSGSGLGLRKGGRMAQNRPRRFQVGGYNAAPGGTSPWQQALMQALQNAQGGQGAQPTSAGVPGSHGMGAAAGAMQPSPGAAALGAMAGASPGMGQPQPQFGSGPGASAAGMGAMAGAMPGSPGAAAMGALAGASQGTPQSALQAGGGMPAWMQAMRSAGGQGGMGGTFGPQGGSGQLSSPAPGSGAGAGSTFGAAATPNQQWGQMLLGSAPGTGLMSQNASNPLGQQALWQNYMGQLQGGLGMQQPSSGMTGLAHGGSVPPRPDEHNDVTGGQPVDPRHGSHYRVPLQGGEHELASHPDQQWGLVADGEKRAYAKGGRLVIVPASRTAARARRAKATGGTVDESPATHASGVPMSRRKATGGVTDPMPERHASGVPMRKATGGITDTAPTHHASGVPIRKSPAGGQPLGTVSKFDSTKGAPGNLATTAAGRGRGFAHGGPVKKQSPNRTLDSTKPAPGNLPTSQAGRDRFADGGVAAFAAGGPHEAVKPKTSKTVLRRRPAPMAHSPRREREAPPPPPYGDRDSEDSMSPTPSPAVAPAAAPSPAPPSSPPPFAKGGAVCASCGKAHGGACKGMARGGKFVGSKARQIRRAEGGTLFGKPKSEVIKRPGALRARLGAKPGEPIPAKKLAKAADAPGRLGRQARLAQTMRSWKHAKGGAAKCPECGKAHGGECKMAAGGAAKVRRGFPNTIKPPKRLARGGTVRGGGAAKRGLKFSGVF